MCNIFEQLPLKVQKIMGIRWKRCPTTQNKTEMHNEQDVWQGTPTPNCVLSNHNLTCTKDLTNGHATFLGNKGWKTGVHSWDVRIDRAVHGENKTECWGMIGCARASPTVISGPLTTYKTNGFFLYVINGNKFAKDVYNIPLDPPFGPCGALGTVIRVRLDCDNHTLSMGVIVNGDSTEMRVVFADLPDVELFPAVEIYYQETSVTFAPSCSTCAYLDSTNMRLKWSLSHSIADVDAMRTEHVALQKELHETKAKLNTLYSEIDKLRHSQVINQPVQGTKIVTEVDGTTTTTNALENPHVTDNIGSVGNVGNVATAVAAAVTIPVIEQKDLKTTKSTSNNVAWGLAIGGLVVGSGLVAAHLLLHKEPKTIEPKTDEVMTEASSLLDKDW